MNNNLNFYTKLIKFCLTYQAYLFIGVIASFGFIIGYKIIEFPYFFPGDLHHLLDVINNYRGSFLLFPDNGRFMPFTYLEFYPFLKASCSYEMKQFLVYLMMALRFFFFCVTSFYLFKLYSKNNVISFLLFVVMMYCSDTFNVMYTFSYPIYVESLVVLLLTLFFIFYYYATNKNKLVYYVLALLCMSYSLYLKEPIFSVFIIFASMRLIFFRKAISQRDFFFQYALLLSATFFLILYCIFAYQSGPNYATIRGTDRFDLIKIIIFHYYFIVPLCVLIFRFFSVVFKRRPVVLADIFLSMSLGYALCIFILAMNSSYYFIPAYFLQFLAYALYLNNAAQFYKKINNNFTSSVFIIFLCFLSCHLLFVFPKQHIYSNSAKASSLASLTLISEIHKQISDIALYALPLENYVNRMKYGNEQFFLATYSKFLMFDYSIRTDRRNLLQINEFKRRTLGLVGSGEASSWLQQNYPEYQQLPIFWGNLIIHKDHLNSIAPLYLDFANDLWIITTRHPTIKNSFNAIFTEAENLVIDYLKSPFFQTITQNIENITLRTKIFTNNQHTNKNITLLGFSTPEKWGTWSDGKKSLVLFKPSKDVTRLILQGRYFAPNGRTQRVIVSINDTILFETDNKKSPKEIHIDIPKEIMQSFDGNTITTIKLEFPDAVSPKSLDVSEDIRELAFGLESINFICQKRVTDLF